MDTIRQDRSQSNSQRPNAWDRIKEALRRDWEQTKHEFGAKTGHELNQDIGDTLKHAVGKQPIPSDDRPNPPVVVDTWDNAEPAIQFGYEASPVFRAADREWSHALESALADRWRVLHVNGRPWDEVRGYVRHGFEYGCREAAKRSAQ